VDVRVVDRVAVLEVKEADMRVIEVDCKLAHYGCCWGRKKTWRDEVEVYVGRA
jgi:hypothetical protein